MNRVQFSMPAMNINITKTMTAPIKRNDVSAWIKSARRVIPQIPDVLTRPDWAIYQEVISDKTIMLELRDSVGNKCALIMERKSTMSG